MKRFMTSAALLALATSVFALDGTVRIHDPSTIVECDGVYYTYGTGGLPTLFSKDGWTWESGGSVMEDLPDGRPGPETLEKGGNNSWAPDIVKLGDTYYMYYSAPGQQPKAAVGMLHNKTLDPESPDYQWVDGGPIVWSDGFEDCNAIDPGVFVDPTDGRVWLTYGSYFGYIRLVELDPSNGQRLYPEKEPVNVAVNCEASIMIYNDGWYYLLATHGSCCQGAASGYNIRMGRSREVTGPFIDNMGIDMLMGGGKLFLGSSGRLIGPGHFGLFDEGEEVQKFSLHYEADLDRGGISVLAVHPLLWEDGWPKAGENLQAGTYRLQSVRTGTALEMAVEGVPVGGPRRRGPGFGPRGGGEVAAIPDQDAAQVSANWPDGDVGARMANYMSQAQQKWTITPVPEAGGYLGAPYFKIEIAGTNRSLAATDERELEVVSAFTGADEQLWRIEQLTDGTWRIMPKSVPGTDQPHALSAIGSSFATLSTFEPDSEKHRWLLETP